MSILNGTIGYSIIQCVLGFLVDDCVAMDTYMNRDSRETNMFSNINKTCINVNYF